MLLDIQKFNTKYSLFFPKKKEDMRTTYPELKDTDKYPAFKGLDRDEMKFVWLMRNVTSPFRDVADEKKWEQCVEIAFHKRYENKKRDFCPDGVSVSYPPEINAAFGQMELFELTHRLKMMLTLEIAMNRMMEDLSGKDIEAEKFTSITLNATKAFREINAFIEKGNFGISEEPTDPLSELSDELTFYHKNKNK